MTAAWALMAPLLLLLPPSSAGAATGEGGSSAAAPTLYAGAALSSPPKTATGDRATDAFDRTNHRRAQLGLSPLLRDAALDRAAAAHLGYLTANAGASPPGHDESAGRPGFTGATPSARAAAAGYRGAAVGENIAWASTADGWDATDGLIDAPYHRQAQLGNFATAGAAMASGRSALYAINFGGVAPAYGPSPSQLVVYPASGERAAPTDWMAIETPNPVPDLAGRRVGFPVSIAATGALAVASFTLEDDKGVAVDLRLLTRRTDDGRPLRNYAFVVPLAPLAPGTTYTARAAGTVDGAGFAVDWRFATAPVQALTIATSHHALPATPHATVDIELSGGTGRYLSVGVVDYDYRTSGAAPIDVATLFSVESTSPRSVRLRRGDTACAGAPLSNCRLRVQGRDSAGTVVTAILAIE